MRSLLRSPEGSTQNQLDQRMALSLSNVKPWPRPTWCACFLLYTSLFLRQGHVQLPRLALNSFYSQSWPWILGVEITGICLSYPAQIILIYVGFSPGGGSHWWAVPSETHWNTCLPAEGCKAPAATAQMTKYKTAPQKSNNSLSRNHRPWLHTRFPFLKVKL